MRKLLLAALAPLVLGACQASGGTPGGQAPAGEAAPGLAWHECPDEVAITITARHRCGTLTVPVDPARAGGSTLSLGVLQAWPASDEDAEAVAVSVGFNFGEPAHDPGGTAALAERLGVTVVALAPRGVGDRGGTSLDCPELAGHGTVPAGGAASDPREAFLTAIRDCRARLTDQGVDVSHFGLANLALDVEALRSEMEVDRWHALVTYGELALVSDAYSASYADRVRAIVKDSPPAPDLSPASGSDGTRSALAALFDECRADRRCATRYPELERTWSQALARVAARPLSGTAPAGEVVVDAPTLLRAIRAMLGGDGPVHVADLPRVITTAADGEVHPTLAAVVAADPGYCNGYRPLCAKPGFSMGAYLSQACPEMPPTRAPADGDRLYDEVFGDSPYAAACEIWDVPHSPTPPAPAAAPTLVLTGHLDAWSRSEWFEDAVVVRGATHDVSGSSPCVMEIRNPWIADPASEPDTNGCDSAPYPVWD